MKKNFILPDELKGTFDRLMNLVPDKLKNDAKTQKTISVYLKLGGEKLARQCVQVVKSNLPVEDAQPRLMITLLAQPRSMRRKPPIPILPMEMILNSPINSKYLIPKQITCYFLKEVKCQGIYRT